MECPHCSSPIRERDPSFCPHCGRSLTTGETGATRDLQAPCQTSVPDDATTPIEAPATSRPAGSKLSQPARPAADFGLAVRRGIVAGGWLDASSAAALSFLALLTLGAVLLIAAKLSSPALFAADAALGVLAGIVILGLATLGTPIHLGDLVFWALPLGSLAAAGAAIVWATRLALKDREPAPAWRRALDGAKPAVPFALLCWIAALAFRISSGRTEVHAGAVGAAALGFWWAAVFGAAGGLITVSPVRAYVADGLSMLGRRSQEARAGVEGTAAAIAAAGVLGAGALLVWIIGWLVAGALPRAFDAGDAVAALVYLAAFLPNLVTAVVTLGLFAPLQVGVGLTAGKGSASVREFSLLDWGGGEVPPAVFALVVVPLIAFSLGGFVVYRRAPATRSALHALGYMALSSAVAGLVLAVMARAGIGAGLLRPHGIARLSLDAPIVMVAAALWAAGAGSLGWAIGRRAGKEQTHDA